MFFFNEYAYCVSLGLDDCYRDENCDLPLPMIATPSLSLIMSVAVCVAIMVSEG